jgi:hypothetical protein
MDDRPARPVHAIIPLAVLEAMRHLDAPTSEQPTEYEAELSSKRLGTSRTVAAQIERYAGLAGRGARLEAGEVAALLRLAGRRGDAALVFADAGRRAAAHAVRSISILSRAAWRILPGFARSRYGFSLVRRAAEGTFGVTLSRDGTGVKAVSQGLPSAQATSDGSACSLYGSAVAALLRRFTDFDGAVMHPACETNGAPECRWHTAGT